MDQDQQRSTLTADSTTSITATPLRAGAVLSRDDLQAARENNFLPFFTADEGDDLDEDDR